VSDHEASASNEHDRDTDSHIKTDP
jgi:hypothetical protein